MIVATFFSLSLLFSTCLAQYRPNPGGVETLKSKFDPDVKVSYKEVRKIPSALC